jgi:hypothetical protein
MNLTKEQVKEHLFEEVEVRYASGKWGTGTLEGYIESEACPYIVDGEYRKHCRLPKPKAKRMLTVKEIWGKTLIHPDNSLFIVDSSYVNGDGTFKVHMGSGVFLSVENLRKEGWRLADDSLTYENATSLEVEA